MFVKQNKSKLSNELYNIIVHSLNGQEVHRIFIFSYTIYNYTGYSTRVKLMTCQGEGVYISYLESK